jgi:predicted RNA-binding protein (virulence factor B family)
MSKKAFKRGVGGLYKARKIVIDEGGIRLAGS